MAWGRGRKRPGTCPGPLGTGNSSTQSETSFLASVVSLAFSEILTDMVRVAVAVDRIIINSSPLSSARLTRLP